MVGVVLVGFVVIASFSLGIGAFDGAGPIGLGQGWIIADGAAGDKGLGYEPGLRFRYNCRHVC